VLYLQKARPDCAYPNLLNRRDSVLFMVERDRDVPLATGQRVALTARANKGLWVLHMLRFLMLDLQTGNDRPFYRFMNELSLVAAMKPITNEEFIKLAEKQYGQPLDWFARQWLYGRNFPEYNVTYSVAPSEGQFLVDVAVETKGVDPSFSTPVIMRVVDKDGKSTFERKTVGGVAESFQLGPYASEPSELVFNEFYSVLCKANVTRKE
jgi:aminopeptidase N